MRPPSNHALDATCAWLIRVRLAILSSSWRIPTTEVRGARRARGQQPDSGDAIGATGIESSIERYRSAAMRRSAQTSCL